jgi:hypothetical protein
MTCSNDKFTRSINNVELKSDVKIAKDSRDGLFDVKVIAKYPKNALKSETIINCQLTMPGTDYSKKQETVYYGESAVCIILLFATYITNCNAFVLHRTRANTFRL